MINNMGDFYNIIFRKRSRKKSASSVSIHINFKSCIEMYVTVA